MDSKSTLGHWDSQYRCISLSLHLIESHPWEVAVGILRHEMAHQLVTDEFDCYHERHGSRFLEACAKTRTPMWAQKASIKLEEIPELLSSYYDDKSEENSAIYRKIKKLYSLAQSSNVHEAEIAMKQAHQLQEKYHLEVIQAKGESSSFITKTITHNRAKIEGYQNIICSLLIEFYNVKAVLSDTYDPKSDRTYKCIDLFGRKSQVKIAEYTYWFLHNQLKIMWNQYRKAKIDVKGIRARNQYFIGILDGFREKLKDQKSKSKVTLETNAQCDGLSSKLMILESEKLEASYRSQYPNLASNSSYTSYHASDHFYEGKKSGKNLVIHQGIYDKNEGKILCIN